jgi:hypothetical protein
MENASDYDCGRVDCVSRGDCGDVGGDGGASDARCSASCVSGGRADRRPGRRCLREWESGERVGGVRCNYGVEESGNGCWLGKSVKDEKLKC